MCIYTPARRKTPARVDWSQMQAGVCVYVWVCVCVFVLVYVCAYTPARRRAPSRLDWSRMRAASCAERERSSTILRINMESFSTILPYCFETWLCGVFVKIWCTVTNVRAIFSKQFTILFCKLLWYVMWHGQSCKNLQKCDLAHSAHPICARKCVCADVCLYIGIHVYT